VGTPDCFELQGARSVGSQLLQLTASTSRRRPSSAGGHSALSILSARHAEAQRAKQERNRGRRSKPLELVQFCLWPKLFRVSRLEEADHWTRAIPSRHRDACCPSPRHYSEVVCCLPLLVVHFCPCFVACSSSRGPNTVNNHAAPPHGSRFAPPLPLLFVVLSAAFSKL
jgi:hypothetical protein